MHLSNFICVNSPILFFFKANFLRTHFPDVDIAENLIREQLTIDARITRKLEEFDPQVGNLLDVVCFPEVQSKQPACLVFPMGELNRDLSEWYKSSSWMLLNSV